LIDIRQTPSADHIVQWGKNRLKAINSFQANWSVTQTRKKKTRRN
jgi:hypothetical protein